MSTSSRKYMSKRQRPCDFCRSRKTACRIEGQLPCRLCLLHGRQCTFIEAAQPRKRPMLSVSPGATIIHTDPSHIDDEGQVLDHVTAGTVQSGHARNPSADDSALRSRTPPKDFTADSLSQEFLFENIAEQFFSNFADSSPDFDFGTVYRAPEEEPPHESLSARSDVDQTPDLTSGGSDTLLDMGHGLNPQILGYSGDMDPYLLQSYLYDASGIFKFKQLGIQSVAQGSTPTQFLISQPSLFALSRHEMGHSQNEPTTAREELENLVPADTGRRLIGLYRRILLSQYPIFAENSFPNTQQSPPYLLAAIYMVAQPFSGLDDVLSIELAYDTLNSQALFKIVDEALRFAAHNPSLAVVQTLVLLLIRPSSNPLVLDSSFKWSLHGALVATAQTLGLHYDSVSWGIASWQVALRRRLSCTIYTIDKWLACSLGRPPMISPDAWLVTTLKQEDSQGSLISHDLWRYHVHFAALGSLLGDILFGLFSIRAMSGTGSDRDHVEIEAGKLLDRLSRWNNEFVHLRDEVTDETLPLRTVCTLGYHYAHMNIFRAIARSSFTATGISGDMYGNRREGSTFSRSDLRSATTAAAALVSSLRQEQFHIFWPQWSQVAFSSICFLILMMATSSPDVHDATLWFQDLHTTRKEIRLKSNTLPVLRLGLLRIDAIFWKGVDKVLRLQPHVQQAFEASIQRGTG